MAMTGANGNSPNRLDWLGVRSDDRFSRTEFPIHGAEILAKLRRLGCLNNFTASASRIPHVFLVLTADEKHCKL